MCPSLHSRPRYVAIDPVHHSSPSAVSLEDREGVLGTRLVEVPFREGGCQWREVGVGKDAVRGLGVHLEPVLHDLGPCRTHAIEVNNKDLAGHLV